MDPSIAKFLTELIPSIGVGAIFLYLYLRERKAAEVKDANLLEAYKEGIRAQTMMEGALSQNTETVKESLELIRALIVEIHSDSRRSS